MHVGTIPPELVSLCSHTDPAVTSSPCCVTTTQVHDDQRLKAIMKESARLHKALTGEGDDSDDETEAGRAARRRGGGDSDELLQVGIAGHFSPCVFSPCVS